VQSPDICNTHGKSKQLQHTCNHHICLHENFWRVSNVTLSIHKIGMQHNEIVSCVILCNYVRNFVSLHISWNFQDIFKTLKLQHNASHCNTLHHTASYCNTMQHDARHCNTLQHDATHCNTDITPWEAQTMQYTATRCNTDITPWEAQTMQYTATRCNTMQHRHNALRSADNAIHCNTMQHTATQT